MYFSSCQQEMFIMKGKLQLILCFYIAHATHGARIVDANQRASEVVVKRSLMNSNYRKRYVDRDNVTLKDLLQLGDTESMTVTREYKSVQGSRIQRLQEKYKGIPVYGASVTIEIDEEGKLTGDASGRFIQGIEEDLPSVEPLFSPHKALLIALEEEADENNQKDVVHYNVTHYIYIGDEDNAYSAYMVSYVISDGIGIPRRPTMFIDAMKKDGRVLTKWNNLMTFNCGPRTYKAYGGNRKMGRLKYGNVPYCLQPRIQGNMCYLENEYVRVIDMDSYHAESSNNTAFFKCKNGYDDEVNGAYSPAIDAFYFGTAVGKMFKEWFHSSPLLGQVILRVHYGSSFERAFWDGKYCNFGDGADRFYPLTTMDIVGHEIGHGVTDQASDLEYRGESGGINEAFSDILGEATEHFIRGKPDMKVGKDVTKEDFLRDFRDPSIDGLSVSHVNDFQNWMDPHHSSGVYRRVFYVLTQQKGAKVRPVTQVFLHANRMYWRAQSRFQEAGCDLLKAAYDLGQNPTPYVRALRDVGINACDLTRHIRKLRTSKPISGITITSEVKPLFGFVTPLDVDSVYIKTTSLQGNVKITVRVGTWENDEEGSQNLLIIKEGYNTLGVEGVNGRIVFTELSVDGDHKLSDVTVRAEPAVDKSPITIIKVWFRRYFSFGI